MLFVFVRAIHVDKCSYSSFAFTAAQDSIAWLYCNLFISSINRYLFLMLCFCEQCCSKFYSAYFHCSCARGPWVVFWQIHSLTFPYSALCLRDPTHTGCTCQTPVHLAFFWTGPIGVLIRWCHFCTSSSHCTPGSSFCPETPTHSWSSVAPLFLSP